MKKRVAIIGAGPAGLVSAKSCLEAGLNPTIFEKSSTLGGVWSGGENGLAWDNMHTNISRWSVMFSDYPWKDEIQDFPIQSEVADYLQGYANKFQVMPFIRFDAEVKKISQSGDAWYVTSNDQTEQFDAVIVASGFFAKEMRPDIQHSELFDGEIIHASKCRPSQIDPNKNIIVYGGSLSGYELAMEFARVSAKPVTHAFSRPSWVLSRYVEDDEGQAIPLDLISYTRKDSETPKSVREDRRATIDFFKACFGNPGAIHRELAVSETIKSPPYAVISDGYLDAVRRHKIHPVKGELGSFDKRHLLLNNDRGLTDKLKGDIVVLATGYRASLPYLTDEIKANINYDESDQFMPVLLNEAVWPKDINGLAFVGFYRGPFFAIMELQARWVAGVLSGRLPAPSADELAAGVIASKTLKELHPRPQFPYGDYVQFADRLARSVGCYPQLSASDKLYQEVNEGFFLPSHYRLTGRYANRSVAERVITTVPYVK